MWLTVLSIIIPALIQLIEWLTAARTPPTNPRVLMRLSKLRMHCRKFEEQCGRLGIPEQEELV